jgi:hypothetical protein
MTLGKGRAEAITDADMSALATEIGCHPADLEAIAIVESNGFGWYADGRMKILFEKHWFYKLAPASERAAAVSAGLARKSWVSPAKGGYKDQSNADARYRLLAKAIAMDEEAALQSISMGRFQIMGFNHALCGFATARQMWVAFLDSEKNQLRAFATFLRKKGLYPALITRDFQKIETVYNGGGLTGAYARKMRAEADKLWAGKWKGWTPGSASPPTSAKPSPAPSPKPAATPEPAGSSWLAWLASILKSIIRGGR